MLFLFTNSIFTIYPSEYTEKVKYICDVEEQSSAEKYFYSCSESSGPGEDVSVVQDETLTGQISSGIYRWQD